MSIWPISAIGEFPAILVNWMMEPINKRGVAMGIETGNVTIQLPAQLYADLQSLAADEQTNPVEIIARLVETARQRRDWLQDLTALREEIHQDGGLLVGVAKEEMVERLRQTRREIFEAGYTHLYE